jgi:hypothetical protein
VTSTDASSPSFTQREIDGIVYDEVQIDYMGRSAEGGMIYADLLKGKPMILDTWILGESGKRQFRIDLRSPKSVAIVDTVYEYDKSIAEGDVAITSQVETRYTIENGVVRQLTKTARPTGSEEGILSLYEVILKTVDGSLRKR